MKTAHVLPFTAQTGDKIQTRLVLESPFSKEIQITLAKGQHMREHKAPLPIIIHVLQGAIAFGVAGQVQQLTAGDMVTLEGKVAHDLLAVEDSIVRLSLSKQDAAKRVMDVAIDPAES